MEAQVQNAVEVALNPQAEYALKQQVRNLHTSASARANVKALAFIAQVKDSPDAWRVALSLLTNQPSRYLYRTRWPAPDIPDLPLFAILLCKYLNRQSNEGGSLLIIFLTHSFLHDVSASEQTRAVLLQLLDPGIADQNHLNLRVEPQCTTSRKMSG